MPIWTGETAEESLISCVTCSLAHLNGELDPHDDMCQRMNRKEEVLIYPCCSFCHVDLVLLLNVIQIMGLDSEFEPTSVSIHPFPFIVEVRCNGRLPASPAPGKAEPLEPLCAMCADSRSRRCPPRYLYMKGPSSGRPPPPPPPSSGADSLHACRDICSACFKQRTEKFYHFLPFVLQKQNRICMRRMP